MFKAKFRTSDFLYSLVLSLGLLYISLTNYIGIDFPKKEELNYSTGVYSLVDLPEGGNHIRLSHINGGIETMIFSCSYSPFNSVGSCGDNQFLEPYVNKIVTVGWYEQPEFLGFKNDIPQLVSTEMDGKPLRSYEDRAEFVKSMSNSTKYIDLPIDVLVFPLTYWLLGWMAAKGKKNREMNLKK